MTRTDILSEYEVDERGIIQSPGRYEAEMLYTPYFADAASSGEELDFMEDGSGEYVSLVTIDDEDRQQFPELKDALYVVYSENDQGFASCSLLYTEHEAELLRQEYEGE